MNLPLYLSFTGSAAAFGLCGAAFKYQSLTGHPLAAPIAYASAILGYGLLGEMYRQQGLANAALASSAVHIALMLMIGWAAFGERISLYQVLAAVLALAALSLTQLRPGG